MILLLLLPFALHANPFAIDFPVKMELTNGDYLEVQEKLRAIDFEPFLERAYADSTKEWPLGVFRHRTGVGLRQTLIDPARNLFPQLRLEKIGCGGPNCIVSFASYDGRYPELLLSIPSALRSVGFNGYFFYRLGGYPNPTGSEIRYAGVPYAFKIFMMLEAFKRGFSNVLWIDCSMLPLRDPTRLFQWIDKHECLFYGGLTDASTLQEFLPLGLNSLRELTGTDVLQGARRPIGGILGLNMGTKRARRLFRNYYRCVAAGTPFLSALPDEMALAALIERADPHKRWPYCPCDHLRTASPEDSTPALLAAAKARDSRTYFYYRQH